MNPFTMAGLPKIGPGMFPAFPWVEAPPGSIPFNKVAAIPTPAAGAGETDVLTFTVPDGFDGVILANMNI
jgi:hypothetical protein